MLKNQMTANRDDQKTFWKSTKTVITNSKNNQNLINLINENTSKDIPVEQTADFINDFVIGTLRKVKVI